MILQRGVYWCKRSSKKSTWDRTPIKLPKSSSLMISDSGISNTIFIPSDPNELCERINLILQEKHAGNKSDSINKEKIAKLDKLLEYKCISKKQHNQVLNKCNLFYTQKN